MNDFDDDFDNFEENNFDDFNQKNSLKDAWQNNPLLKIFTIIAGVILLVAAIIIFGGDSEDEKSTIAQGVDQRETLGGELSPNYTEAIEDVNRQRLEQAVQTGTSTIPMLVNPEEQELLTAEDELPPFDDFDPLKTFRNAVAPKEPEVVPEEPVFVEPEEVFTPPVQQAPAPSPEAVQALAQAMSASVGNLFANHDPSAAQITLVTPETFLETSLDDIDGTTGQLVDTDGDGIPDTPLRGDSFSPDTDGGEDDVIVETILIPSGTINYAQVLIEANSDTPGPVLAQLVSGPLRGARLIGSFAVREKVLVLNFDSIVVDGINQPVSAVAIDPNTTVPGLATDVDNRYFTRVILPAAAKFLEGVGAAIAQDTETTVTVSGDTVIEETEALDFEQELGRGVEEAFDEISEFLDEEADSVQRLVRIQRGTPIGVFFTEPVLEIQ